LEWRVLHTLINKYRRETVGSTAKLQLLLIEPKQALSIYGREPVLIYPVLTLSAVIERILRREGHHRTIIIKI